MVATYAGVASWRLHDPFGSQTAEGRAQETAVSSHIGGLHFPTSWNFFTKQSLGFTSDNLKRVLFH